MAWDQHTAALWGVAVAGVCVIALLLQFLSGNETGFMSNWFIPDGITLATTFDGYWSGRLPAEEIQGGLVLNYLYVLARWSGALGFAVTNIVLLWIATAALRQVGTLSFALLAFPYFLLAVALPSKDLVMLVFSVAFVRLAAAGRAPMMVALGLGAYFFRDGGAVILLVATGLCVVVRHWRRSAPYLVALMFVSVFAVNIVAERLFGDLFIYARALQVQQDAASAGIADAPGLLQTALRIFGNATNLAFRPAIMDADGGLALTGIVYLISGVGLLYALAIAAIQLIRSTDASEIAAALLLYASLAVVAINPFVQPRYLLPAAAITLAIHVRTRAFVQPAAMWLGCACITLLGILAYVLSPIGLPADAAVNVWSPHELQ